MRNLPCLGAVLTAIPSALTAQTFIVDAANGPGATFGELPVAVATVPSGSILLVRPGVYGRVEIDGKALSILATGPGVIINDPWYSAISVRNLVVTQAVTLRGITEQGSNVPSRLLLRDCNGPVLIDDFTSQTTGRSYDVYAQAVAVQRCRQVTLRNCHLRASEALHADDSDIAVENCDLIGHDAFAMSNGSGGMGARINGGNVTFARCRVRGGNGGSYPQVAMVANAAEVRLCEDPTGIYAAGTLPAVATPAIIGLSGTLVRDPSAAVQGSNGGAAVGGFGLRDVIRPLPSLRTVAAPPGGVVTADVTTPIGEVILLAVSLPGPVTMVPGIDGGFRLHPATAAMVALGVPQSGVPVAHSIAVPNDQALAGACFAWQAVAWSSADGLRASNASIYAH